MAKFQNKGKKLKNKSHSRTKKFIPKSKTRSKTPRSNPNKRDFQKNHKSTLPKNSNKNEEFNQMPNEEDEFGPIQTEEKVERKQHNKTNKNIANENSREYQEDLDDFKEDHFNDNEFYFDENDYVDDGENLDFGEEDYVESDQDSQIDKEEEEEKEEKILTMKDFKRIYLQATKGKSYGLSKLVSIFSKLTNPDLKFNFVDNSNLLNSHKFYKKIVKIAVKIIPDMFNAKISSYKNKNEIPNSLKQLIKRFLSKYSSFVTYTEKGLINFIFKYIHKLTDLVLLFNNLIPLYFKISLKTWVESFNTRASDFAFNFVVSIVEKNPAFLDEALKYCYLNYLNIAKSMNISTYPQIQELQRNIIGLLSSNYEKAYIVIFKFIRRLCVQLRATINDKKKSSIKNIYNWQFINSLSLWTNCTYYFYLGLLEYYHRKEADIKLLAYPLVQVIIGTIRLNFVDTFFCLRLNLVKLLNEISRRTGIFIPVANYLIEILESNDFTKKFKDFKETNIDLFLLLKLKPESFNNYNIVNTLFEETVTRITEYLAINSNKLIFPEFSIFIISRLRKLNKCLINKNFKESLKTLIEKVTKHIEVVNQYRKQHGITIKDTEIVKEHEKNLLKENSLIQELEKIKSKEKDFIESRISQVKGEFIEIK